VETVTKEMGASRFANCGKLEDTWVLGW
jgi:hypothetical protein